MLLWKATALRDAGAGERRVRVGWENAAGAGDADARFELGMLSQDSGELSTARHWIHEAAALGDEERVAEGARYVSSVSEAFKLPTGVNKCTLRIQIWITPLPRVKASS